MELITVARLLYDYEPDTGVFRFKKGRRVGKIAGSRAVNGYIKISIKDREVYAHRLAWLYVHGYFPPDQIDHINGNPADNRLTNLRLANQSQNNANCRKRKDNITGNRGVSFDAARRKFLAQLRVRGRRVLYRRFDTMQEAAAAYRSAAADHFGEFARS